jgi:NADH:quinone reductase (non-electrogenic)
MAGAKARNVLVLGAGYAGLMAALRLSRRAGSRARVTVVNGSDDFVERIRLHQRGSGQELKVRSISKLLARRGARLQPGWVRAIDPERRTVEVDGQRLGYDSLVIALGSRTDLGGVPGAEEHAHTLDGVGALRLSDALRRLAPGGRIVVVGGGLTAIESASELAESFPALRIILVSAGNIGAQLSSGAQSYFRRALSRLGVELSEGSPITSVTPGRVSTSSGPIDCDVCLWAAGFRAQPLLEHAGFQVNQRGQVWVDPMLRALGSAQDHTWVVGDAAAPHEPVGAPLHMTCKTAMPMGAHAADNIVRAGQGAAQTAFSFGDTGYCVSLGRRDGLLQLAKRDGRLKERIFTGRAVAVFKELVCRYTVRSLWLEAHWGVSYRWLDGPEPVHGITRGMAPPGSAKAEHS